MTEGERSESAAVRPGRRVYEAGKRIADVVLSASGLVLLAPLGGLIALVVKLGDGGSVFFTQQRIGLNGRPFSILKFRTMVPNAESLGPGVTQGLDARVTRVGRLLRRTKLDELPQLLNVFKGEMSFVGPRPEVPRYTQRYTEAQREILRYKPGITDLATVRFRNEEDLLAGASDPEDSTFGIACPENVN